LNKRRGLGVKLILPGLARVNPRELIQTVALLLNF